MLSIEITKLKCVIPEDYGDDGDETYIEVRNNGQKRTVWGPKRMIRGQVRDLSELAYGMQSDFRIYIRDEDAGGFPDADDKLGSFEPKREPGVHTKKVKGDGAEYEVTYRIY